MKFSYGWLQTYFKEKLPAPEKLADIIALHAFEVEGVEKKGGDTIFDIDILPNRGHDALSCIGMAKEIAVLTDTALALPEPEYETVSDVKTAELLEVEVENAVLVPRAMKRLAVDVSVGDSPQWLKERLASMGQKSLNNVVDITNFVMFETGQPVHAFDYDKIAGDEKRKMVVRGANKGESITTLDGEEYTLEKGMLVWADDDPSMNSGQGRALDIAGIKGGQNSGVDEGTKRIVISACNFNPTAIRRTSRGLGLLTDASKRFEQGITPELAPRAIERVSELLAKHASARIAADTTDIYPKDLVRTAAPYKIGVSLTEINDLLGTKLKERQVGDILERFVEHAGFSYEKVSPLEKVLAYAPVLEGKPYKYGASVMFDSPRCFDCGSFVNHVYVQAGFALPRMAQDQYAFGHEVSEQDAKPGDLVFSSTDSDGEVEHVERLDTDQVRKTKQTIDFMPGITFSQSVDHVGIFLGEGKVIHASPKRDKGKVVIESIADSDTFKNTVGFRRIITEDEERYVVAVPHERLDLRAGNGFKVSGNKEDLIEEIGRVYGYENISPRPLERRDKPEINKMFYYTNRIRDILVDEGFSEVMTYTFQDTGAVEVQNPFAEDKKFLRQGLVKSGLAKAFESNAKNKPLLGQENIGVFEIGTVFSDDGEHTELGVISGKKEGGLEALERIEKELGVKPPIKSEGLGASVNLTKYIEELPEPNSYDDLAEIDTSDATYTPISQYPFVLRDIALWVPKKSKNKRAKIKELISEKARELLVRADLFDEFEKDGRTSYAFHLVFQSHERTLTDEEINTIMDSISKAAEQEGWEVR